VVAKFPSKTHEPIPKAIEMYDNYLIPFGKYKFTALCRLPSSYLLEIYGKGKGKVMMQYPEIKTYIETNMDTIKNGNGITTTSIPQIIMPCAKYLYLTQSEARKELARIQATKTSEGQKKPVRYYYCEKCGGWHLTSKEK